MQTFLKPAILCFTLVCFFSLAKLKAQTVYSSEKGEKYHTADCRLSGDASSMPMADAKKKGKKPCEMCKPNELGKKKLAQCSSKTADGTRCKRMTANKNKKCFQHQ